MAGKNIMFSKLPTELFKSFAVCIELSTLWHLGYISASEIVSALCHVDFVVHTSQNRNGKH